MQIQSRSYRHELFALLLHQEALARIRCMQHVKVGEPIKISSHFTQCMAEHKVVQLVHSEHTHEVMAANAENVKRNIANKLQRKHSMMKPTSQSLGHRSRKRVVSRLRLHPSSVPAGLRPSSRHRRPRASRLSPPGPLLGTRPQPLLPMAAPVALRRLLPDLHRFRAARLPNLRRRSSQ